MLTKIICVIRGVIMEELREKLNLLIESKGPLDEETLNVSRKLDKLLLNYYKRQNEDLSDFLTKISA